MLPDVLQKDLLLVVCGTAVASHSAKIGSYYAGRGNKFWPTLYQVGLTDRILKAEEFRELLSYRIGLTDLVKTVAGNDDQLNYNDFDIDGFENKIRQYSPRMICFNGKKAAETYLARKANYGLQPETVGEGTLIFVAPSTSGAANAFWELSKWRELGKLIENLKQ